MFSRSSTVNQRVGAQENLREIDRDNLGDNSVNESENSNFDCPITKLVHIVSLDHSAEIRNLRYEVIGSMKILKESGLNLFHRFFGISPEKS